MELEFTDNCELSYGNQTQMLWQEQKCSEPLSHLFFHRDNEFREQFETMFIQQKHHRRSPAGAYRTPQPRGSWSDLHYRALLLDFILPQSEWLRLSEQKTTSAFEGVRKGKPQYTVTRIQINMATMELHVAVPQKTRNRSPVMTQAYHSQAHTLSAWLSRHRDTGSSVFIAVPFSTARTWKQPRCPSTECNEDVIHIHNLIQL